jgi:hypothetical protein
MGSSTPRVAGALAAGVGGAVAAFAGICVVGAVLLFSIQWGEEARIVPFLLAVGLAIAAGVSLANGAIWFALVQKQAHYRILWMLLSLAATLSTPFVAPAVMALLTSRPESGDLLGLCGVPIVILGLFVLAFRLSLPGPPAMEKRKAETGHLEPTRPPVEEVHAAPRRALATPEQVGERDLPASPSASQGEPADEAPSASRGCLAGLATFGLGLVVPGLTAGGFLLLLHLATALLLKAGALIPGTGTRWYLAELLGGVYFMLAPLITAGIGLIVSLVLSHRLVVPRIPSKAGKIINTLFFCLLWAAVSLVLSFLVVGSLYTEFDPGWWQR